MNFIIKSSKVPACRRPVHWQKLGCLLRLFGIEPLYDPITHRRPMMPGKRTRRSLWDVWELVRERWKVLRKRLHPDAGGNTEQFAVMSSIHDTILLRLRRDGIFPE